MSDTPRTNASTGWGIGGLEVTPASFSRELECENTQLRAIFPRVLKSLGSGACSTDCSLGFLREIPREVELARKKLEREISRLQMELDASCNAEELRQVRADNARLRDALKEAGDDEHGRWVEATEWKLRAGVADAGNTRLISEVARLQHALIRRHREQAYAMPEYVSDALGITSQ